MMFDTYKKKVTNLRAKEEMLREQLEQLNQELTSLKKNEDVEQKVVLLIQECNKEIQDKIVIHITDVVNTALNALFPDRYEFKIDFITKNNKTNADMYIIENGYRIPIDGALSDLTCVALRIAVWSLSKTDGVLLLDEPALGIAEEARPLMAQLLKQLSEEMEIQIILVSHTREFIDIADKVERIG